jgi:hypothetical protein
LRDVLRKFLLDAVELPLQVTHVFVDGIKLNLRGFWRKS